jgi:hypothetical protein
MPSKIAMSSWRIGQNVNRTWAALEAKKAALEAHKPSK